MSKTLTADKIKKDIVIRYEQGEYMSLEYWLEKLEQYHKSKVESITDEEYQKIAQKIFNAENDFIQQDAGIIKDELQKLLNQ